MYMDSMTGNDLNQSRNTNATMGDITVSNLNLNSRILEMQENVSFIREIDNIIVCDSFALHGVKKVLQGKGDVIVGSTVGSLYIVENPDEGTENIIKTMDVTSVTCSGNRTYVVQRLLTLPILSQFTFFTMFVNKW